ncbi:MULTISPECIES: SagB family peptide dehydrogenase [Bacillus cereus group]|uniref:NADH oxidase n=1 Tax=Bacillus cereus TaxID=1396 RepID=A0AA44QBV1_BACCE|nr:MULTISPECIES: SagB family peptide dehydrogenase [Bacillus cereus group]EEL48066.1 NADH oxidase [Bacillus cereus Rock3-44]PFN09039.1 NADH oxidase [Bacillus cereus]PFO85720.1 NADH oxidase [Bacillus cereus]PFR21899.1 NADH oxidase [Bacillus cereus]PFS01663.1 NADH oxidase [Bacillus cereus]
MELETFLHNLHFSIDEIMPKNENVNWEDAPLPYKLYRGLPIVPLSLDVPLTFRNQNVPTEPTLEKIGHFLWYTCGLTQICQPSLHFGQEKTQTIYRRFIPSGGALYPNELYIYLRIETIPHGIYHYDVAHHRLILLREGNFDAYLTQALGNRCDISACFGTTFVSTMFWKNFFKYNNFSYRLQGLDAGVLIGQLLETAKQFGYTSGVYFQFLDRAMNHLLGLSEQEESVYAVIPLSKEPTAEWFYQEGTLERNISSHELSQELPLLQHEHFVRSKHVMEYPMITQMNTASMLESTDQFQTVREEMAPSHPKQTFKLPNVQRLSYDFASVCQKRYSPDLDFVLQKINKTQLATLLQEASLSFPYQNDLDGKHINHKTRVSLCGCFYNVEGLPNGAYSYNSMAHTLESIQPGDLRQPLQSGMTMDNVNLFQVPLCLHVMGNKDYSKNDLGYRGYRIQQMEAGMLAQKLVLAASAINMGGHPLLGFDASLCDKLYEVDTTQKTALIQIPVGPYRPRTWLKGYLHN